MNFLKAICTKIDDGRVIEFETVSVPYYFLFEFLLNIWLKLSSFLFNFQKN